MTLLTNEQRSQLIENGKRNAFSPDQQINNVPPVCWIYDEMSRATWLLTEIDRNDPDRAWGLVDAGYGKPDFEPTSLRELEECHQPVSFSDGKTLHIGTQCVKGWKAKGTIAQYIAAAAEAGHIVELEDEKIAA
jgi:hypothetical protein